MIKNNFQSFHVEAWDILQHLFKVKNINDHTLHFVAEFSGQLDLEKLKKAVNATIEAFTLIRCGFNESRGYPYWEDKGYTADDIIEVLELENTDESTIQHIYKEIDAYNGRQLKIKVIQRNKKH